MRLGSEFKMRMSILNTATTEQMGCIIFFFFRLLANLQIRNFFDTADIRINEHGVIRMINDVSWFCLRRFL